MMREKDRDTEMDLISKDIKKDKEDVQSKKPIWLIIFMVVSILIIATVITLLVGHFKYNWFKKVTKETEQAYDIALKLSRNVYQANYFTETKTINTKVFFTEGSPEYTEQKINTISW